MNRPGSVSRPMSATISPSTVPAPAWNPAGSPDPRLPREADRPVIAGNINLGMEGHEIVGTKKLGEEVVEGVPHQRRRKSPEIRSDQLGVSAFRCLIANCAPGRGPPASSCRGQGTLQMRLPRPGRRTPPAARARSAARAGGESPRGPDARPRVSAQSPRYPASRRFRLSGEKKGGTDSCVTICSTRRVSTVRRPPPIGSPDRPHPGAGPARAVILRDSGYRMASQAAVSRIEGLTSSIP